MKPKPFYFMPFYDKGTLKAYTLKGKHLYTKKLTDLTKLERFGIVCFHIADGQSLSQVATGKGFRPSKSKFLIWQESSEKMQKMFKKAKEMRVDSLVEQLVDNVKSENEKQAKKIKEILQTIIPFSEKEKPPPTTINIDWLDVKDKIKSEEDD